MRPTLATSRCSWSRYSSYRLAIWRASPTTAGALMSSPSNRGSWIACGRNALAARDVVDGTVAGPFQRVRVGDDGLGALLVERLQRDLQVCRPEVAGQVQ